MNQALIVRAVFFFGAVLIAFVGIIHPTGLGLMADLNLIGFYLPLAIIVIAASRFVNDFCILSAFNNNSEVVEKKNVSVAIVEGGTYIGTAFVTVGALAGWEGGFITSCLWLGVGQIVFVLLAWFYRLVMPHVFASLDNDNAACGISLGCFLASGGLVLGQLLKRPITGWSEDLVMIASNLAVWLVSLFVVHFVTDRLFLPSLRVRTLVMEEGQIGAGVLEGVVSVVATLAFITLVTG
jgi:uncharacterized membrane protein YjfL (UPF0719 family)